MGSYEVGLTHDLRHFLTTSAISPSSPTRSEVIFFDWAAAITATSQLNKVTDRWTDDNSAPHTGDSAGKEYVIEGVSIHTVILTSPYTGPVVVNGQPRVYLRTKLIPMGTFCVGGSDPRSTTVGRPDRIGSDVIIRGRGTWNGPGTNSGIDSRPGTNSGPGTNSVICTTTSGVGTQTLSVCGDRRRVGEYLVPPHQVNQGQGLRGGDSYPITSMCAHPTLHHVVVGFLNDSVSILG